VIHFINRKEEMNIRLEHLLLDTIFEKHCFSDMANKMKKILGLKR